MDLTRTQFLSFKLSGGLSSTWFKTYHWVYWCCWPEVGSAYRHCTAKLRGGDVWIGSISFVPCPWAFSPFHVGNNQHVIIVILFCFHRVLWHQLNKCSWIFAHPILENYQKMSTGLARSRTQAIESSMDYEHFFHRPQLYDSEEVVKSQSKLLDPLTQTPPRSVTNS